MSYFFIILLFCTHILSTINAYGHSQLTCKNLFAADYAMTFAHISEILQSALTHENINLNMPRHPFKSYSKNFTANQAAELPPFEIHSLKHSLISGRDELGNHLNFHQMTYGLDLLFYASQDAFFETVLGILNKTHPFKQFIERRTGLRLPGYIPELYPYVVEIGFQRILMIDPKDFLQYTDDNGNKIRFATTETVQEEGFRRITFINTVFNNPEYLNYFITASSGQSIWIVHMMSLLTQLEHGSVPNRSDFINSIITYLNSEIYFFRSLTREEIHKPDNTNRIATRWATSYSVALWMRWYLQSSKELPLQIATGAIADHIHLGGEDLKLAPSAKSLVHYPPQN